MSFSETSQTIPFPIPTLGYDSRVPLFNMPQVYSPWLFNFELEDGYLKKRQPHVLGLAGSLNNTLAAPIIFQSSNSTSEKIISVQAGANGTTDGTTTTNTPADVFPYSFDYTVFNNVLFVSSASGAYSLNPTTLVYTLDFAYGPTVLAPIRRPITSFRERLYLGEGTNLGYGNAGAIAGALNTYAMSSLITSSIIALGRISISASFTPQAYFVVGTNKGDVLVFSGSNPSDPSWTLVGRFLLPIPPRTQTTPTGPNMDFVEIPNDLLINIKDSPQVYSLKQLLTTGLTDNRDLPFDELRPFFNLAVPYGTDPAYRKSCAYLATDNSVVMLCNFILENPILTPWYTSGDFPAKAITSDGSAITEQCILFKCSLGENRSITPHTCPQGSAYAQLRAGSDAVYSGNMWDIVQLFKPDNGVQLIDYNPATSANIAYAAVAKFPPPNASKNKQVHDLIMYSNLVATNSFSYQVSKLFDFKDTVFQSFTSLSTDLSIQANILSAGIIQKTAIIGIKENSSNASTPFSCYGMDMLLEVGGDF